MKRELHVRFCERLEGESPSCLLGAFEISACTSLNKVAFQITLADLALRFVEYLIPSHRSTAAQSRVLRR